VQNRISVIKITNMYMIFCAEDAPEMISFRIYIAKGRVGGRGYSIYSFNLIMPRIYGRVYDADSGRGIPYVVINVSGRITSTDGSGYFSIEVPQGTYTLEARTPMYSPFSTVVTVVADLRMDIPLRKAIL